jgi:hypothetical protein
MILLAFPAWAAASTPLALEFRIPLGEVSGRIDHLAYDSARQRLYVAELGNDTVAIVDIEKRRLVRTVPGFAEPQGIGYEPFTDTVYVANAADGSVRMFAGADFAALGQISLGADADNVRVDAEARRVYVGHGEGAIAVIDGLSRKLIRDIPLRAHPEGFQLDIASNRIFVNLPDEGVITAASIDPHTPTLSWPTSPLRANFPLAIDVANQRVLAAFRQPPRLEAFSMSDGTRAAGIDTCGDADDVFLDAGRRRVYVICGAGTIDAYDAGKDFRHLGRVETGSGTRTGWFAPDIDRLLVAVRASHGAPAEVWVLRPSP